MRPLEVAHEVQTAPPRPPLVQLDNLLVRLPRRVPRVERKPLPLLQARQLLVEWPPPPQVGQLVRLLPPERARTHRLLRLLERPKLPVQL